jgi:NhaP-type Na+/H+ or K+/H+ antiporter
MSNELISIVVLIAVFLVATTMGINMGVLGIVAAFAVGTRSWRRSGSDSRSSTGSTRC